jgi:aryl-alcohol dehydrogenase-like predicted oxidoreductase
LVIDKAIDLGVTLFDTADVYGSRGGSECILGDVLGSRRKEIVLATKFRFAMDEAGTLQGASRRYIMTAVEASLKRLKTDYIDLYQLHGPDPQTPMQETLKALDDLIRQGKVRYIGCSNLRAWQVVDAHWLSKTMGMNSFISFQDEYSLLVRDAERGLIPAGKAYGLGLLPYFPLACGMLTGKYKRDSMPEGARMTGSQALADRYLSEKNWGIVETLEAFAADRGHTLTDLAFGWLLAQAPVSSVIAGATKPEQVEQNVAAANWQLTADDLAAVASILSG